MDAAAGPADTTSSTIAATNGAAAMETPQRGITSILVVELVCTPRLRRPLPHTPPSRGEGWGAGVEEVECANREVGWPRHPRRTCGADRLVRGRMVQESGEWFIVCSLHTQTDTQIIRWVPSPQLWPARFTPASVWTMVCSEVLAGLSPRHVLLMGCVCAAHAWFAEQYRPSRRDLFSPRPQRALKQHMGRAGDGRICTTTGVLSFSGLRGVDVVRTL
jgi:hypothetical protein